MATRCYREVILLSHWTTLFNYSMSTESPHFALFSNDDPTSEAPLTVGVHFLVGPTQCYLMRLSGNHFGSSHHFPTYDQSAAQSDQEASKWNWISVANRNGFPGLTNGDSMTDDDLKWLKSLCVWCVRRGDGANWLSKELNFHLWKTFQDSSPTGTPSWPPIRLGKVIHKIRCSTLHSSFLLCYFVNQGEEPLLQCSSEKQGGHSDIPC